MIRRYAVCATAAATVALSVTGCMGDGGGKKAGDTAAGSRALAAKTVADVSHTVATATSFQGDLSMDIAVAGKETRTKGHMWIREKPQRALRMSLSATVPGGSATQVEEILLDGDLYMKMPELTAQSGGKPWIRISLSKMGKAAGVNMGALMDESSQTDPATNMKMLTASKDAHKIGAQTINGVSTTHYAGTYSMRAAMAKLPAEKQAAMKKAMDTSGIDKMHYDVWVDGQSLPRKLMIATAAGATTQMTMTMTYTDFNKPASIKRPPADQVTDWDKLMAGMPKTTG